MRTGVIIWGLSYYVMGVEFSYEHYARTLTLSMSNCKAAGVCQVLPLSKESLEIVWACATCDSYRKSREGYGVSLRNLRTNIMNKTRTPGPKPNNSNKPITLINLITLLITLINLITPFIKNSEFFREVGLIEWDIRDIVTIYYLPVHSPISNDSPEIFFFFF